MLATLWEQHWQPGTNTPMVSARQQQDVTTPADPTWDQDSPQSISAKS